MRVLSLVSGDWIVDQSELLGPKGAFGSVYKGQSQDGRVVAIKILRSQDNHSFRRELDIGSLLLDRDFRYVVPILDIGFDAASQEYALVMPLADANLHEAVLGSGPFDEVQAAAVLADISRGVEELAPHLVHRDLKPENILHHDGHWKLADFSTSRLIAAMTQDITTRPWLSPKYAAPEQWAFEEATTAADIYAIGCIAHFLVTGQAPFEGSHDELRASHLQAPPPRPEGVSDRYSVIITGCMRKPASERPTITQLQRWIEFVSDDFEPDNVGATALARSAARLLHEKAAEEARARRMNAARTARREFEAAAKQRAAAIRNSLFTEIAERVPGASIHEVSEKTEVLKPDFFGLQVMAPGPDRIRRATSVTSNVYVEMLEVTRGPFVHKETGETLLSSRIVVCCRDVDIFGGDKRVYVDRLLLYRPDQAGDYRWYEHRAYPKPPRRPPGPPPPPQAPRGRRGGAMWRSRPEPAATPAASPQADADEVTWEDRILDQSGLPIDDEAVFAFIDRWLSIVAQAIDGNVTEDDKVPVKYRDPYRAMLGDTRPTSISRPLDLGDMFSHLRGKAD